MNLPDVQQSWFAKYGCIVPVMEAGTERASVFLLEKGMGKKVEGLTNLLPLTDEANQASLSLGCSRFGFAGLYNFWKVT